MKTKPYMIIEKIHENWGYHQGRADAEKGRKIEANDDATSTAADWV